MNLSQIRTILVEQSGRFDLVDDDGANYGGALATSGANFVINKAQRLLDLQVSHQKSLLWHEEDLDAGEFKIELLGCKMLSLVYRTDSSGRVKLTPSNQIFTAFPDNLSSIASGVPAIYGLVSLGLAPAQSALTAVTYPATATHESERLKFGDHHQYRGLIIMPPADATYTISALGRFYGNELAADSDVSFWTSQEPYTLLDACRLVLERDRRIATGEAQWQAAVDKWMLGLEIAQVNSELEGLPNQVRG